LPTFTYTAKSFSGEEKSGTLEASDKQELARLLRQEGYVLISAARPEISKKRFSFRLPFLGGVSLAEKMMFTRNLRVMVGAGISLPRALNILSLQSKSRRMRQALVEVAEGLTKGQTFSDALSHHQDIFSELFISMVAVGEESGTLEEVLGYLTTHLEREYELRSKIRGALIYPAIVICAMVGIGFLMLIVVVPQLAATFKELQIELPFTTRVVIFLGTFLSERWYLVPLLLLAALLFLRFLFSHPQGKRMRDALLLGFPVISPLVKQANNASITRTLGSLISAGVPILRALEILSRSIGNTYFKTAIADSVEKLKKGGKLSEALGPYKNLFSLTMIQMVAVGEETGQMAEILKKLADFYEDEVTNATKNLASAVEPLLMLLIGAVVGFFAVSMIQPMYSMLQAI